MSNDKFSKTANILKTAIRVWLIRDYVEPTLCNIRVMEDGSIRVSPCGQYESDINFNEHNIVFVKKTVKKCRIETLHNDYNFVIG